MYFVYFSQKMLEKNLISEVSRYVDKPNFRILINIHISFTILYTKDQNFQKFGILAKYLNRKILRIVWHPQ